MSAPTLTQHAVRSARRPAAGPGLAAVLRERTRTEHERVERAFALDARLADRAAYATLLIALRGFVGPLERELARVDGWERLRPPIDVRSRARIAALDDDLRALGRDPQTGDADVPAPLAVRPSVVALAAGLGCLYVLEGSALGGRIVARQARRRLGDDLPLSYFETAGRPDLGRDWRALQAALDAFGRRAARGERAEVVRAARRTFAGLAARLESARSAR